MVTRWVNSPAAPVRRSANLMPSISRFSSSNADCSTIRMISATSAAVNVTIVLRQCTWRQQRDDAPPAVDANPLAILDLRGGIAGAHHRRQPVFARDDGGMAHGAADIGHGGANFLKDGRPGGVRHLADEYIPLLQARNLVH